MSFRMSRSRKAVQDEGTSQDSIFSGSHKNSGLPDMRQSIFNSPLGPTHREPPRDTVANTQSMFFLPSADDEDLELDAAKRNSMYVTDHSKRVPISPDALTPHLMEIERLKLTLLHIQGMIHSQDELTLGVRQNLLRRMVQYLKTVKTVNGNTPESRATEEIKHDLDTIMKEQEDLIVSLRQEKLKKLVEMKPQPDKNKSHFQQPKLNRQISRSVESGLDDHVEEHIVLKPLLPRVAKLKRSETARADRSQYFDELAKKSPANEGFKRIRSLNTHRRRKSVDDVYASIGETHLSRGSKADLKSSESKQQFLKLNKSGQLVFASSDKTSPISENPPNTQPHPQGNGLISNKQNTQNKDIASTKDHKPIESAKITPVYAIPKKCHAEENPMLSSDKDFVDVDDLIHFNENHKSPTQRFVRGYNAVNSASFREPSTCTVVENAQAEIPAIKRDRITISNSPRLRKQGKQGSFDDALYRKNVTNIRNEQKGVDLLSVHSNRQSKESTEHSSKHSKQSSYTTSIQINLLQSESIPTETDVTKPNNQDDIQKHEEVEKPVILPDVVVSNERNAHHLSKSNKSDEVEFANNATIMSQLKPEQYALDHAKAKPDEDPNTATYVNNASVLAIDLKRGVANIRDSDNSLRQIELASPTSPIFTSFKEFSETLSQIRGQTSSTSNQIENSDPKDDSFTDSDTEDPYQLPPKGKAPNEKSKPRLIKKPPRRSLKLKRHLSRSLTDLTEPKLRQSERSQRKKTKPRPTSFIHDYANILINAPVYENIGNSQSSSLAESKRDKDSKQKHDYMNIEIANAQIATQEQMKHIKPGRRKNGDKKQDENHNASRISPFQKLHPKDQTRAEALHEKPDPVFDNKLSDSRLNEKSPLKRRIRRSVSDDVIYEQDQKRLREDLRRLTELQDEIKETSNIVNAMWRNLQRDMQSNQVEIKPKRTTLPRAMAPNFGKKWKCIIM